jgi:hypothetical protein
MQPVQYHPGMTIVAPQQGMSLQNHGMHPGIPPLQSPRQLTPRHMSHTVQAQGGPPPAPP